MVSRFTQLSDERKVLQERGDCPAWMTTQGYQMLDENYLMPGETPKELYQRVARAGADVANRLYPGTDWYHKFFDAIYSGWLSPSTPVLSNFGTDKGLPVSCSGTYVDDSIVGFYKAKLETAVLTKNGFGTSAYLGNVRARGSLITSGGTASGIVPLIEGFVHDMSYVAQGTNRRGAWAGYVSIDHGDFDELADHLLHKGDGLNIGWLMTDEFLDKLDNKDKESVRRYQKVMKIRKASGKGYIVFPDKAQRSAPFDRQILASNLCTEIFLPSDKDHSFTCVLSSLNLAEYDAWKNTDLVNTAMVFLDCVAQTLIDKGRHIEGMENTVRFTEKSRALGLGVLGWHTYVQKQGWSVDSLQAQNWNLTLFEDLYVKCDQASIHMAKIAGEPEWCRGKGRRNLTYLAVAPTMSTAAICGGVSQGIEPVVANIYTQASNSGDLQRINPVLLERMKSGKVYNRTTVQDIIENYGSVQHVSWLSPEEKSVFRTAFELDQSVLVKLADHRQEYIDQGQSLNLFFRDDAAPQKISAVHKQAAKSAHIKSLYYQRTLVGAPPVADSECVACEG